MINWRTSAEALTDYFEKDAANECHLAVAEVMYFIGEVEDDGLMDYVDRRDESYLRRLRLGAKEIGSKSLAGLLPDILSVVDKLPSGQDYYERILAALEENEEDPFEAVERKLIETIPAIDADLAAYLSTSGGGAKFGVLSVQWSQD